MVNMPQVHAHQPESQRGILYRRELQTQLGIHLQQHLTDIPAQDVASPHHVVGIRLEPRVIVEHYVVPFVPWLQEHLALCTHPPHV